MFRWTTRSTAIVSTLCMAIACSQSRSQTVPAASGQSAGASASGGTDASAATPTDCNKVYSQADVAGLLEPPVKIGAPPGSIAWCWISNDFSGDITVTVGSNESIEVLWNDATVSSDRTMFVPFPGVGDKAVFKAGTSAETPELASRKGRVFCIVTYDGGTVDHYKPFKGIGGEELGKRLGALCNKAFATVRA